MAAIDYIKQIHIAKSEACLSDPEYRQLLFRLTGETSSKALDADSAELVLKEIKAAAEHRDGWQVGQLKKFNQYRKFAKLSETEARAILHEITGVMHESSPDLTQQQFEHVMSALETALEEAVTAGRAKLSDGVDLRYWRGRLTGSMATSRQLREIETTWQELSGYLSEEKRTQEYLQGIICQAAGRKPGKFAMTVFVAKSAIDALKRKLDYEKKKLAEQVPF
jgi:hypothetical protein